MTKIFCSSILFSAFIFFGCETENDETKKQEENTPTCVTCSGANLAATELCKGENGNAYSGNIDTGVAYETYISILENQGNTCN